MSLNRCEQMTHDYLLGQPDELRHWQDLVRREVGRTADKHQAASTLERELWRYVGERAEGTEPFRSWAGREGLARSSMRSLAELLILLWFAPEATERGGRP
jgi:hypothetical protein